MKSFIKYFSSLFLTLLLAPFRLFPVRKTRITFAGLTGGDDFEYCGSPRCISECLQREEGDAFSLYWITQRPWDYAKYETDTLHFYRHYSLRAFFVLLTSAVVVTSGSYAPWFPFRRRKQYVINTWHGGGAYKRIENDRPDANWATRRRARFCAKNIRLFLSSCRMANEKLFRHAFLYEGEILECGTPRNDALVRGETKEMADRVRSCYGIEENARILLYAPTYRESASAAPPDLVSLQKILEKSGEKWYVLYRAHRYSRSEPIAEGEKILSASHYEDMQDLLCAADMLITDYSSCIWDYSFLYRPCFLYTPDLKEYLEQTGFYVDISAWPFPVCEDFDALVRTIEQYDAAKNRARIQEHHRYMGSFESGRACEAVCARIRDICKENKA